MAVKVNEMKIVYYEKDDTLFLEFQKGEIVRDESLNWNINISPVSIILSGPRQLSWRVC